MGFGGTLISAIAYELIPASNLENSLGTFVAVLSASSPTTSATGSSTKAAAGTARIDAADQEGSGAAMFIGALLDGVPEAFILGITLKGGGGISVAFVTAIFVSNIPQGIAGTTALKAAGYMDRHVFRMWTSS